MFSSALNLVDLNDYLGPSQECIKPVKIEKSNQHNLKEIQIDLNGNYVQINTDGSSQKLQKSKMQY